MPYHAPKLRQLFRNKVTGMRLLLASLAVLFAGLALIYWAWLPRGREKALALGMVLIILAVPLLLNSVTHLRRRRCYVGVCMVTSTITVS